MEIGGRGLGVRRKYDIFIKNGLTLPVWYAERQCGKGSAEDGQSIGTVY